MYTEDMDVSFVNTFLGSFCTVFNKLFSSEIERGSISFWENQIEDNEIAIISGVLGKNYAGIIVFSMNSATANRMVKVMGGDSGISKFGDILFDVLGEWMNIISGNACTDLSRVGIDLEITTPTIVLGQNFTLQVLNQVPLSVPMHTPFGIIEIIFGVKKVLNEIEVLNLEEN